MEEIKNGLWWWHVWQRTSWELHPPHPGTFSSAQVTTKAAWEVIPMVIIFSGVVYTPRLLLPGHWDSWTRNFPSLVLNVSQPWLRTQLTCNCFCWGYETPKQSIASVPPWVTQNISGAHMNQVKKSKENLTAPKILQHMAEVEEDLRTSTLPADPSVGGTSPLPCSSIWELPGSLLFPKAGHSAAAGQPSKQTRNFCKMCLDISHINHECCSPLWIQQLPIGINRKPFYPLRGRKDEGVTTVNCVSELGHAAKATNK